MSNFKKYIFEMVYNKNIGFQEMINFFKEASENDIKKMSIIIKNENWDEYKKLIFKVLKVKLK